MIEYVFNPFTTNLDIIDVFPTPQVEVKTVDAVIYSTKVIVAANPIRVNTERILVNGMELTIGPDADYTLANDHIHFSEGVLQLGDRVKITYQIKIG